MSGLFDDRDDDHDGEEVQDEDGLVERRIKQRITDARDRVADRKDAVLV